MLVQLYPRCHARFSSLPLLGPVLDGFIDWLRAQGYPRLPIRARIRETPRVVALLRRRRVRRFKDLSRAQLLKLAPRNSQDDIGLAATIRSLAEFLDALGLLARPPLSPSEQLVAAFRLHLDQVRGLADITRAHHGSTAAELLQFIEFDTNRRALRRLGQTQLEGFIKALAARLGRESLQHAVAHVRSFLRFLVGRGEVVDGLASSIDTPRLYRGERLPRALPWGTVKAFLAAIDRSTAMGRRDYAMFLLIATYGLRASEVAALRLDDIEWRADRLRVPRPKVKTPIVLPLTEEVGAALLDYLRSGRPHLPHREFFLRVRAPAGPIAPTAVTEAFQTWTRRGHLPISHQGPHCLRHSLAVHLLRRGTSLKAIGDLLGHRSSESTCVYLRLHLEDLRDAAIDLPRGCR
jgi:integrase/recombinase XerD